MLSTKYANTLLDNGFSYPVNRESFNDNERYVIYREDGDKKIGVESQPSEEKAIKACHILNKYSNTNKYKFAYL